MLLSVKIKLTAAMLGSQVDNNGVRRFSRDKTVAAAELPLDIKLWTWALSQAAETLSIPFSAEVLRIAPHIKCPTLALYVRRWRQKGKTALKEDRFESVHAGTELTIPVMLFSKPAPEAGGRPVLTIGDFVRILELTGKMIGISPWGSKFGYGRFDVVHVEETTTFSI